uniref:myeloid leukemia factor 1-like n=1 Tax=Solea senegalensis TaxID=28829 RepID=UPI001CD84E1F|nr:myeloid leukemia factor 1-like [Solea senegalensis]
MHRFFTDFEDDPFFSEPFRAHRENMQRLVQGSSDQNPDTAEHPCTSTVSHHRIPDMTEHSSSSVALRDEQGSLFWNNFSVFDNSIRNRIQEMHQNFENMSADPNIHSFSSSSVMTYSKVGNEAPKVFQATSSTQRAPGGIKETRRALKDSESGLEKMAVGHHIRDRGYVLKKKYNNNTREEELIQDFQNIDESEAQSFDDEWNREVSKFQDPGVRARLEEARPRAAQRSALTARKQSHRNQSKINTRSKSNLKGLGTKKQ